MSLEIIVGHTATFRATSGGVPDANATWSSTAPAVATATAGPAATTTVTGVAVGNATIVCIDGVTGCSFAIPVSVITGASVACEGFGGELLGGT